MSTDSSTVVFSTLNWTAPALGFAVAGREGWYGLAIDQNSLGVVSAVVIEFVCDNV